MISSIARSVQSAAVEFFLGSDQYPDPPTVEAVGGKAYNLYKLGVIQTITVPPWFTVPTASFKRHLEQNQIVPLIHELDLLCKDQEQNKELVSMGRPCCSKKHRAYNIFLFSYNLAFFR